MNEYLHEKKSRENKWKFNDTIRDYVCVRCTHSKKESIKLNKKHKKYKTKHSGFLSGNRKLKYYRTKKKNLFYFQFCSYSLFCCCCWWWCCWCVVRNEEMPPPLTYGLSAYYYLGFVSVRKRESERARFRFYLSFLSVFMRACVCGFICVLSFRSLLALSVCTRCR